MSGVSDGQSQARPCSGTKTLRRCRSNGATENVVLIDLEGDNFDNVVVFDVPESLSKKLRRSSSRKDRTHPWKPVICIDDDDESTENDDSDDVANENGNISNGVSSSPTANDSDSAAVDDECQFVQENISPVKLSKGRRTYSGKAPPRIHYGLGSDSETDSSDDDFPDCELVEDLFGEFRKKWEKASLRRKCQNRYGKSGIGVSNNQSRVSPDGEENIGMQNVPEQRKEAPNCLTSGKISCERDGSSPSNATRNTPQHSSSCNSKKASFTGILLKTRLRTRIPYTKIDADFKSDSPREGLASNYSEKKDWKKFEHDGPSSKDNGQGTQEASFEPRHEEAVEQLNNRTEASEGKERTTTTEPYTSNNEYGEMVFCSDEASPGEELRPGGCESMEEEEFVHAEPLSMKNKIYDEEVNHDFGASSDQVGPVPRNNSPCRSAHFNSGVNVDKGLYQENSELLNEKLTSCSNSGNNEDDDVVHGNDGQFMYETESCIIGEREKLKETDEYKRAAEEEWAARQLALKIQAEEAQQLRRLRKRRKAELMRILDMEKRQKQRLEEIRETQKKDEEQMNLKEVIRAEIRRELTKLELGCHDMASLLRSLGIAVGSDPKPLLHEVRAACKRALFTFHPDRAAKLDTRQQVESEEKFKLISRMKDKFLLT